MSAQKNDHKPHLSREILKDSGIFLYENICRIDDHHKWIEPLRQQLTSFRGRLPRDTKRLFTEELAAFRNYGQDKLNTKQGDWSLIPPNYTYVESDMYRTDSSIKKMRREVKACRKISKSAIHLRETNQQETMWMHLLREHFFRTFPEVHGTEGPVRDPLNRWELLVNLET
ncbi:hypothetical protein BKA66DRAFT_569832 [Pyrenochaeta sp. MPI-SDFR-AT-0127]|nr:hypothetical protein BKA66DRAFT_569832 [Pyrenochaeta sp. MPI-SDFR-AT-0127]